MKIGACALLLSCWLVLGCETKPQQSRPGETTLSATQCGVLDPSRFRSDWSYDDNLFLKSAISKTACSLDEACEGRQTSRWTISGLRVDELEDIANRTAGRIDLYFPECGTNFADARLLPWDDCPESVCGEGGTGQSDVRSVLDQIASCGWFQQADEVMVVARESFTSPLGCSNVDSWNQLAQQRFMAVNHYLSSLDESKAPREKIRAVRVAADDASTYEGTSASQLQSVSILVHFAK